MSVHKIIYHLVACLILVLPGCTKEEVSDPIDPNTGVATSILTTTEVSDVTSSSASSGGNIASNGGSPVSERGVCWSTSQDPTINDSKTSDGEGTGTFNSSITGLNSETKYYVRAYATNGNGTAYGNELSFTTRIAPLVDIDGNTYRTIRIGSQVWMAENLRTTHLPNGDAINQVTSNSGWWQTSEPAFCYYNNDANNESETYGALYNLTAAEMVCPEGWHLPSEEEWKALRDYISADGFEGMEAEAMKSVNGWNDDGNGVDEYGFTALPGGWRDWDYGAFFDLGNEANFWSTRYTSISSTGWFIMLSKKYQDIWIATISHNTGMSVRCVKD